MMNQRFLVGAALLLILAAHGPARADEKVLAPPAHLRVRVKAHAGPAATLLDPAAPGWQDAAPIRVILSRTPRIYQTEPPFTGAPPACEVRGVRVGDRLVLRLQWTDATKNALVAPERSTAETASFHDAAAVMMPVSWSGGPFPSLVMGDKNTPVRLFYWNAGRGSEELTATGRATPQPTGKRFAHRAVHADGRWALTLDLPAPVDGCPMAFAVWDGATGDRDGLKFFSIWYVLMLESSP